MFQKLYISIILLIFGVFLLDSSFALSQRVHTAETYPWKMDTKNINGLGKSITTDFFAGALSYQYPFIFPSGWRWMTPNISLTYSSNNTDAFSPYGYGFSLSIPHIQRSGKKWVNELYINDEFSAFWNDLIREIWSESRYRSKEGLDLNLYILSGSTWTVYTPDGKMLILWSRESSRLADPENQRSKIYAWFLDEERDAFGHTIQYIYSQNGGQPYITDILYWFDTQFLNPMYQIHFSYQDKKSSLSSFRTQFEVSTKKLLSQISFLASWKIIRGYEFRYDSIDSPVSHLIWIRETSLHSQLPETTFYYGSWQLQHLITRIDNNRWAQSLFEYTPSTTFRDGSGWLLNNKMPFVVMTLSKRVSEDMITGLRSQESYEYAGWHYYYDMSDIWGREYVGFANVTITDDRMRKVIYFHQSHNSDVDKLKFQDHISKKWRVYRTDIFDKITWKLLRKELMKFDSRILFWERRFVFPVQKLLSDFDSEGKHRDIAFQYDYDADGNMTREMQYWMVASDLDEGTFIDTPGDMFIIERGFTSNPSNNLYQFPVFEKVYGFSWEILQASFIEYDNVASWVLLWLPTTLKQQDVRTQEFITKEKTRYNLSGIPIEKIDAWGNIITQQYDDRDIILLSQKNPLGWENKYKYDYAIGKNTQVINQNNVVTNILYDDFAREVEVNRDGWDGSVVLSKKSYDDTQIPNSITLTQFFSKSPWDNKITRTYQDGWNRPISTIISTENPWQFRVTQLRYDMLDNPIYTSYPYFSDTDNFDSHFTFSGVIDGEKYRNIHAWVSYMYDTLSRIILQKDSTGVTKKEYVPWKEIITNTLGNISENQFDVYGNIKASVENIDNRKPTSYYTYDALWHITSLTDAYDNIREWKYDGLGRLQLATDSHAQTDLTYGIREYFYDNLNRLSVYKNPNNIQITFAYDALSRIIKEETNSGSFQRTYMYDLGDRSRGTLSQIIDPESETLYTYNPFGEKIHETRKIDGRIYTLSYSYNLASTLTSMVYPDGGTTQYLYNKGLLNWIEYIDPKWKKNSVVSILEYAPNFSIKKALYGNGTMKTTERDPSYNYRLERTLSQWSNTDTILDTRYSYDPIGNITQIQENGVGPLKKNTSYTYDALARIKSMDYRYSLEWFGREQNKSISYDYDDIGNIKNTSNIWNYLYGGLGFANPYAVTQITDMNYEYDALGWVISRLWSKENTFFQYSPSGELTASTQWDDITNYTYDYTHRRISKKTKGFSEYSIVDGYEVEYESGVSVSWNSLSSDFPIPYQWIIIPASTGSVNFWVIDSNTEYSWGTNSWTVEVSSWVILETTSQNSTETQSSIFSGNLIEGSIVTSASGTNGAITYSGEVKTDTWGSVVLSEYYNNTGTLAPMNLITNTTHIMFGDERIATFQSQSSDLDSSSFDTLVYHLSDHLNSSSVDISETWVLLQARDYLPFWESNVYEIVNKKVRWRKWGYLNKYGFANKKTDEETDLQYFEKRYYDPRIGKFTSEDPVFWEVGITKRPNQYFTDPQQWNSYSYVRNNPINMIDPSGEMIDYSKTYIDTRPNWQWEAYFQATDFDLHDWDSHYLSDNHTAIRVSFDEINTSFITPLSFDVIRSRIDAGVPGVYTFQNNDTRQAFTTKSVKDYTVFWDLTFKTEWDLTITEKWKWSYQWNLKSFDDVYDFTVTDKDWEVLSRWPRNIVTLDLATYKYHGKWTPFNIQITWEKGLTGNWNTNWVFPWTGRWSTYSFQTKPIGRPDLSKWPLLR